MSTFGQLKTSTDSWLARDDLAMGSDIDQITLNTEAQIARDIRTVAQERNTTLTADARQTVAPADFLEARYLAIDTNTRDYIEYQTPEVIRKQRSWSGNATGTTGRSDITFYTIEGLIGGTAFTDTDVYFTWAPAGNATTPTDVELGYFARWPAFVNDPDTNWLLTNHFDIYLWAMLHNAALFLQEEGLAQGYLGKYAIAKEDLQKSENRKRFRGQSKKGWGSPRVIV